MLYYLLLAFLSCIVFQLMFLHFCLHHPVSIILTPVLKAWVKGSTWIPIFDVENTFDAGTIPRKVTNFIMGIALIYVSFYYVRTCFVYLLSFFLVAYYSTLTKVFLISK